MATIAIDATYSLDPTPSGIAVYSRRLLETLAESETPHRFLVCYRLSRLGRRGEFFRPGPKSPSQPQFSVRLYQEPLTFWLPRQAQLFHSLAQRPPGFRFEREIVTVHDVFPITGRDYSVPDFLRKFSALLVEAVGRAARVVTPSEYTATELVRTTGVAREKIRVIPEGVDPPAKLPSAQERLCERRALVGEGNEMVLTVGVIQTRKNTLNALKALALLPARFRLVLAGGEGYGAEAALDFIRREGLDSKVVRLGYVAPARLRSLYQAASVFLFPSLEEGFGLPVLEAMAHGAPVVASKTSALPEVGGDAALYIDPRDPKDIAEKVRRVAEDELLRQSLIARGLGRAPRFTWRRTAEATLAVYNEVLAS